MTPSEVMQICESIKSGSLNFKTVDRNELKMHLTKVINDLNKKSVEFLKFHKESGDLAKEFETVFNELYPKEGAQ